MINIQISFMLFCPNFFSFSPDTVGFVLSHTLSLILLFNGFHFRGNLFQGNPRKSYLCSWMPKYALIEQVRLLKAFCQKYGIYFRTGRTFVACLGAGKSFSSLSVASRWLASVYGCRFTRSAFWVHISLILMRVPMSAASISAWAWAWAFAVAYFLARSFFISLALSPSLSPSRISWGSCH